MCISRSTGLKVFFIAEILCILTESFHPSLKHIFQNQPYNQFQIGFSNSNDTIFTRLYSLQKIVPFQRHITMKEDQFENNANTDQLLKPNRYQPPQRLNESTSKWTPTLLETEALKFKTKSEFKKSSPLAYRIALERGKLDEICHHLTSPSKWSNENVKEEALKYKTRSGFQAASSGAYQAGQRKGILDQVCQHMPMPADWSNDEM